MSDEVIVRAAEGRAVSTEEAMAERFAAMEARLARLESFVARWASIVGAPSAEKMATARDLLAAGFGPQGGEW